MKIGVYTQISDLEMNEWGFNIFQINLNSGFIEHTCLSVKNAFCYFQIWVWLVLSLFLPEGSCQKWEISNIHIIKMLFGREYQFRFSVSHSLLLLYSQQNHQLNVHNFDWNMVLRWKLTSKQYTAQSIH